MDSDNMKTAVRTVVDSLEAEVTALSRRIHARPELAFQERESAALLGDFLEGHGFTIERGLGGLETAFRATYGRGRPVIAFLAEYDALPEMGHGCGHNIICTSATTAGVASRLVVDETGGTVQVIGTPGEEIYGGKALMISRGCFDGLDAAMMVHPGTVDAAASQALACQTLDVEFFGKAAHAAARPEEGVNALDAMIISFNAIAALRQHVRDSARMHGIITDGGQASNIVPSHSAGSFILRATEDQYLDELKDRFLNCFEAGARATGASLKYSWGEARYATMISNMTMAHLFRANMSALGRHMLLADTGKSFGSTDMGNVSHVVPGIHPFVSIAPPEVLLHSPEFAQAAVSEAGFKGLFDGARAMAMTAVDLFASEETLAAVAKEFRGGK